jgi:hypothetical protein
MAASIVAQIKSSLAWASVSSLSDKQLAALAKALEKVAFDLRVMQAQRHLEHRLPKKTHRNHRRN